jgi:hypothetical protein
LIAINIVVGYFVNVTGVDRGDPVLLTAATVS